MLIISSSWEMASMSRKLLFFPTVISIMSYQSTVQKERKGEGRKDLRQWGSLFLLEMLIYLKPNVTVLHFTKVHCSELQKQFRRRKVWTLIYLSDGFCGLDSACIFPSSSSLCSIHTKRDRQHWHTFQLGRVNRGGGHISLFKQKFQE